MTINANYKIKDIRPYKRNAKKHPEKQIRRIAESIKKFGFNQPIVVDKKGVIIIGHGRYEAAKLLRMTEVPVLEADLTKEQAKEYRIADNKLNESDWDFEILVDELKELSEEFKEFAGFNDLKSDNIQPLKNTEVDVDAYEDLDFECPRCGFKFEK